MRWAFVLFAACGRDPASGTAVGNPGNLGVAMSDVPGEVALETAVVAGEELELQRCLQAPLVIDASTAFDALSPAAPLVVPAGGYCGATLFLAGPTVLRGTTVAGTAFELQLPVPALSVPGRFAVDGDALLLAVSLAELDVDALDARGGGVIGPSDPYAMALAGTVPGGLWRDEGDGRIGPGDVEILGAASGDTGHPMAIRGGSQASAGGCATAPAGGGWIALGVLLLRTAQGRRRVALLD